MPVVNFNCKNNTAKTFAVQTDARAVTNEPLDGTRNCEFLFGAEHAYDIARRETPNIETENIKVLAQQSR